jgi:hypothetical protein
MKVGRDEDRHCTYESPTGEKTNEATHGCLPEKLEPSMRRGAI